MRQVSCDVLRFCTQVEARNSVLAQLAITTYTRPTPIEFPIQQARHAGVADGVMFRRIRTCAANAGSSQKRAQLAQWRRCCSCCASEQQLGGKGACDTIYCATTYRGGEGLNVGDQLRS